MTRKMTDEDLLCLVRDALACVFDGKIDRDSVCFQTDLSTLCLDSLTSLEFAAYLEEELGLTFTDARLTGATTVQGIVSLLRQTMDEASVTSP